MSFEPSESPERDPVCSPASVEISAPQDAGVHLPPMKPGILERLLGWLGELERAAIVYFGTRAPRLRYMLLPLLLLTVVLYMRHPATNYIFDEQEALLANPYVNGVDGLRFKDVIHRDFWGLPPTASIGSYRPLPNVLWRMLWVISEHPFYHHLYNLFGHALASALLGSFAYSVTRRRLFGWLTAVFFLASAVITEAVSGIVGIADVFGGLGAVLALNALRLPAMWMPLGVFAALILGLFSKESALVCVPLLPLFALLTAPHLHPRRPARAARALLSLGAAAGAFVLYVELRKSWFPSPLPAALSEPLSPYSGFWHEAYRSFLIWFHQAPLPKDPLNNPFAEADTPHRVAGALRVYWRGLGQVVFPLRLSGDYSFPQEPVPTTLYGWQTIAGAISMIFPLFLAPGLMVVKWLREWRDCRRLVPAGPLGEALMSAGAGGAMASGIDSPLLACAPVSWSRRRLILAGLLLVAAVSALITEFVLLRQGAPSWVRTWPCSLALLMVGCGLVVEGWRSASRAMVPAGSWPWRHLFPLILTLGMSWMVISYFPHSNIPVVLPTVRAERFWYFPVIGTSLMFALIASWAIERWRHVRVKGWSLPTLLTVAFIGFQLVQAYSHSMDYKDDLSFWKATKKAVPNSAKAHLNYSVMVGARGDLEERLVESKIAAGLAPEWPMAHVYTGDTLCRLHRVKEAWPHYERGFGVGPNSRSLIALAIQCLYDEKALSDYEKPLRALAEKHPGSWLAYLAIDTLDNHEEHKGVDPQYRPRGYNEGLKDK